MRRPGGAALAPLAALVALLAGAPAAPAAAGAAPHLPSPPECATAVALWSGTSRSKPAPLPGPTSDAGGARLAQPGLQLAVPAKVPRPPALRATAWIVADLATGNVLASCNAHVPLAPASTLKVLTAVALHPRIDPASHYVARPEDAAVDGTKVGLAPGSVYTVDNLWHGLLMGSGNDAANALASLAGGSATAAGVMTATARSLGAMDTVVRNTSGLDAPGQVSSVYDLAVLGRALLRDPGLAALVRTKTYAFPAGGTALTRGARRTYQIQNHDLLLFRYPGATGIKNGYTRAAGASFVGSARRAGHSYVVALLRTDYDSWRLAAALLDWAFAHGTEAAPVGTLVPGAGVGGGTAPAGSAGGPGRGSTGGVPAAVTAPVKAVIRTVPTGERTGWLVAALLLALAGGAVVRRLAARGTTRTGRTGSTRSGSKGTSKSSSERSNGGRAPASRAKRTGSTGRTPVSRAGTNPRRSSR